MMDESGLVPVEAPAPAGMTGSTVFLLPALGLEGGAMAEFDLLSTQDILGENRRALALLARWTVTFVRYGAVAWDFVQDGKPVPFDAELLVKDYTTARLVAAKANELYSEAVMRPLFEAAKTAAPNRAKRRSASGRTGSSTSRGSGSTPKPPASSSPADSDGPQLRIAR